MEDVTVKELKEQIALQDQKIAQLEAELKAAKNELCLHCGRYKKAYLGQCDGCRWSE